MKNLKKRRIESYKNEAERFLELMELTYFFGTDDHFVDDEFFGASSGFECMISFDLKKNWLQEVIFVRPYGDGFCLKISTRKDNAVAIVDGKTICELRVSPLLLDDLHNTAKKRFYALLRAGVLAAKRVNAEGTILVEINHSQNRC